MERAPSNSAAQLVSLWPAGFLSSLRRACQVFIMIAFSLSWAGFAGCASIDNPRYAYPTPDYAQFVTGVQPVLGEHCASAACHGSPHRTLKLYAIDFLRAPPEFADTPLDEKHLTDAELAWNYDELRARLRGVTAVGNCRLLRKCLPVADGGIRHADGIAVFSGVSDPDYQTLKDWVVGGLP